MYLIWGFIHTKYNSRVLCRCYEDEDDGVTANIARFLPHVVVIDLPLLRVAVEGSDNPVSLEKPCQASLPPDQQGRHSLRRHPEVQYVA